MKQLKNIKLTTREKILLQIVLVAFAIYIIYIALFIPLSKNLSMLKEKQETLSTQADLYSYKVSGLAKLTEKKNGQQTLLLDTMGKYYSDLRQDQLIIEFDRLLNKAMLKDWTISFSLMQNKEQEYKNAKMTSTGMRVNINMEGTYESITTLLELMEGYNKTMIVESLTIAEKPAKLGVTLMVANISLGLISFAAPNQMVIEAPFDYDFNNATLGKQNPFSDESTTTPVDSATPTTTPIEPKPVTSTQNNSDFFISTTSIYSDFPTVVVGERDDTKGQNYATADENKVSNVSIILSGTKNAYTYSLKVGEVSRQSIHFTPKGNVIGLQINSTPRTNAEDIAGIRLNIENNTDLPMRASIKNDDAVRPRVLKNGTKGSVSYE